MTTVLSSIGLYIISFFLGRLSYRLWLAYKGKKDITPFQDGYDLMDKAYRSGDVALVQDLFDKAMSAPDYNDFDRGIIKAYSDCSGPNAGCPKLDIKELI